MKMLPHQLRRFLAFNLLNRDLWIAAQAASVPSGSKVLDVSAGSCPYRKLFDHCEYRTQDFQQLADDQLRHGGYGTIDYVCDAAAIPVGDSSFDVVICTEVLEHIGEPLRLIQEFSRVVKPGGLLLLTAPLGSGIHQEPHHYYGGFTPFWYRRFLPEHGFEGVSVEPNKGSFAFFSQESLRFLKSTSPWSLQAHLMIRAVWAPVWFGLLPVLGILVPIVAHVLDEYDQEKRFTVGYHVKALKRHE
jgi:ubiquinone/menaquinone biosynthesis C-methylase UbiE